MSTSNESLRQWIDEVAALTKPDNIVWCDGSEGEYQGLIGQMLESGTLTKLNDSYENCYLHRSDPSDVARVEVRAMYGGLPIAVGLLSLAGLSAGFRRTAIGALTFLFIGLALGRGYGMIVDSMPGQYNQIAVSYELVSAAIAGFLSLNADKNALSGW